MITIQVKALSKRNPVPLGTSLEKIMGDFWIIVNKIKSDPPVTYIMLPEEVKKLAHREEKDGKVSFWLEPAAYEQERFRDAWPQVENPEDIAASSDK